MAVNTLRIIKSVYVLKYELACMLIVADLVPVQALPLEQCMERLYTGVVPRVSLAGIASCYVLRCVAVQITCILYPAVRVNYCGTHAGYIDRFPYSAYNILCLQ